MSSTSENPDILNYLTSAHELYLQGELDEAIDVLNKALILEGNNQSVYAALGLLFFKKQQFSLAKDAFLKSLSLKRDDFNAMYNLALCYEKQHELKDAIACLLAIIEADPFFKKAYLFIAKLLLQEKNVEKAEFYFNELSTRSPSDINVLSSIVSILIDYEHYEIARKYSNKLLELDKNNYEFFYNAAVIEEKLKNIDQAMVLYEKCLSIFPRYFSALNNLGVLSLLKQKTQEAKDYFKRALEEEPGNESVEYTLSALMGIKSKTKAPEDYVAKLFDAYADHFDQHLQLSLDYCVPTLLYNACKPYLKNDLSILDLGCGTGLTLNPFLEHAKKTIGVDLSEKMLLEAKKKNMYSALYKNSIVDYLSTVKDKFDLILAGDVLVYTGNLVELFKCLSTAIAMDGLFAFSTEISEKENFMLRPSGRFAHSKNYIQALAKTFQFDILVEKEAITRYQFNEPVLGIIYLIRRNFLQNSR